MPPRSRRRDDRQPTRACPPAGSPAMTSACPRLHRRRSPPATSPCLPYPPTTQTSTSRPSGRYAAGQARALTPTPDSTCPQLPGPPKSRARDSLDRPRSFRDDLRKCAQLPQIHASLGDLGHESVHERALRRCQRHGRRRWVSCHAPRGSGRRARRRAPWPAGDLRLETSRSRHGDSVYGSGGGASVATDDVAGEDAGGRGAGGVGDDEGDLVVTRPSIGVASHRRRCNSTSSIAERPRITAYPSQYSPRRGRIQDNRFACVCT